MGRPWGKSYRESQSCPLGFMSREEWLVGHLLSMLPDIGVYFLGMEASNLTLFCEARGVTLLSQQCGGDARVLVDLV